MENSRAMLISLTKEKVFILMEKQHFKKFENDFVIFISYLCLCKRNLYPCIEKLEAIKKKKSFPISKLPNLTNTNIINLHIPSIFSGKLFFNFNLLKLKP